MSIRILAALVCGAVAAAGADAWKLPPETAKFKPGPGVELVMANCVICHSADYIGTQPRLNSAGWRATVEKMRTRYGAPIATNNVDALVKYLATTYGSSTGEKR